MPKFVSSLPWWGWALLGFGAVAGGLVGWMWAMSYLARHGNDLGIPDRQPMRGDGSQRASDERRPL